MFCKNCGNHLESYDTTCPKCGEVITKSNEQSTGNRILDQLNEVEVSSNLTNYSTTQIESNNYETLADSQSDESLSSFLPSSQEDSYLSNSLSLKDDYNSKMNNLEDNSNFEQYMFNTPSSIYDTSDYQNNVEEHPTKPRRKVLLIIGIILLSITVIVGFLFAINALNKTSEDSEPNNNIVPESLKPTSIHYANYIITFPKEYLLEVHNSSIVIRDQDDKWNLSIKEYNMDYESLDENNIVLNLMLLGYNPSSVERIITNTSYHSYEIEINTLYAIIPGPKNNVFEVVMHFNDVIIDYTELDKIAESLNTSTFKEYSKYNGLDELHGLLKSV